MFGKQPRTACIIASFMLFLQTPVLSRKLSHGSIGHFKSIIPFYSNPFFRGGGENDETVDSSLDPSEYKRLKKRKLNSIKEVDETSELNTEEMLDNQKMPSLFNKQDEDQYDKYAACLAATDGLRQIRDNLLSNNSGNASGNRSWSDLLNFSNDGKGQERYSRKVAQEECKRACTQYVLDSSNVVKALGLSVSQFNQLGREIGKNPGLKKRILEQAFLYRMSATIKMDRIPLIEHPNREKLRIAHRKHRVNMFARSMTEIEDLRTEQTERLKKSLNVESLPSDLNICDPNVIKLLNPRVRAVCEAFPLQAEEIIKKYGLDSDEFNQMLAETRENPFFRWRLKNSIEKQNDTTSKD